ncbi:MAG: nucleotide exchange factor GrpE [Clostridia bacterium]|nr:nucleotide exchange factor GrpE [Clostridia bacterium]
MSQNTNPEENLQNEVEETVTDTETTDDEVVEEKTPLELAEESIASLTDRLMRTAAEFDNFKKRSQREKSEVYSTAVCDTVEKLLPVLDNLERAVSVEDAEAANVLEGVKMIQKQFVDALAAIGVLPMDAVGKPFDPEKHNAVMTEESDQEENTVLEELMKGYVYQDKVVRHAMVKVSN